MNKDRRIRIRNIINDLSFNIDTSDTINELEFILMEEEDAFYNTPESLQMSWRGQESEEAIDILNEAVDLLNEINEGYYEDEDDDNGDEHDIGEVINLLEQIV